MGNSLNIDITDKVLIIKESAMNPSYRALHWRVFRAGGGFGCSPTTGGQAVFGTYLADGEEARVEGYQFEREATEEEIALAEKFAAERTGKPEFPNWTQEFSDAHHAIEAMWFDSAVTAEDITQEVYREAKRWQRMALELMPQLADLGKSSHEEEDK